MDTTSICQGCLAFDRYLYPLGNYRNTFDMIITRNLYKNRSFKSSRLKTDLWFCWECIQLLRNVINFQERVLKAQEVIDGYLKIRTDETWSPLTRLTSTLITKPNLTINTENDKKELKTTTENVEVKIKKELPIESETLQFNGDISLEKTKDLNTDISDNDNKSDYDIDASINDYTDVNLPIDIELKKEPNIELFLEPDFIPDNSNEIIFVETKLVKKKMKRNQVIKEKRKRKLGKNKTIENENYLCRSDWKERYDNLCKLVSISEEEMLRMRDSIKNSEIYVNSKIKCELCLQGFTITKDYDVHVKTKHDKHSPYKCDICHQTFRNIGTHKYHRARHFRKLQCNLCGNMYHDTYSLKRHLGKDHNKGHDCHLCGEKCKDWSSFLLHRKKEHRENNYKCNDCDASFPTKREIEYHCRKHMTYFCRPCQSKFKNYMTYRYHKKTKHINENADETGLKVKQFKPELAYCVECNIQYESEGLLKKHLRNSYRHNPPANKIFPCPECPKTYKKACTRNYHYNKAHVGITKFYCEPCQKYYLNNFQLRRHKSKVHDRVPSPRDKLCAFCGRGFSTNRTLKNHIMTHTGERPYDCGCCGAKFSQKYAMKTHMKNVHRMVF